MCDVLAGAGCRRGGGDGARGSCRGFTLHTGGVLQFPQGLRGGGHERGHLNRDQREEESQQGGRLGIEPSPTGQELRGSVCGELGVSESSEEASAAGVACVVVGSGQSRGAS